MKSVVTGGAGFIGRHLVAALCARGDEVTVVDVAERAPPGEVRYVRADITDPRAMAEACAGAEVVFHAASLVHTRRDHAARVWEVNLGGTENVLRACRERGVPRLVYVSSASTVYEGRDIENGDESLPYARSSQAPYADSKIAAERAVLAANGRGLATCALRPHVVFGPGDGRFLAALLSRMRAGRLRFAIGRERKLSDFTYVANLVRALVLADEALSAGKRLGGEAYFITNGEPTGFWDFVAAFAARLGHPAPRHRLPFWVAYGAAALVEGVRAARGDPVGGEDGLSRFAIRYLCTHHYFSIEKARRHFGYAPEVSLTEGIERSVRSLVASAPRAEA